MKHKGDIGQPCRIPQSSGNQRDYHGCHCSHRDFDDSDGCGAYGDCDGDVTADVSSLEEYPGHNVIRPQTDSDESSAALETGVMGAFGTGAPWSQTGGGGGGEFRGLKKTS